MSEAARSEPMNLPIGATGAVVTVGTFDGMHRGHQDVLRRLAARGEATGRPSVVITFDPHPLEVVNPAAAPPLLTTFREKLEVIVQTGVSYVAVLPFTPGLAALGAEQFVDAVLRGRFSMTELLIGHDHGFGRGRTGDSEVLRALGRQRGFGVTLLEPVAGPDGKAVSSTTIRQAIADADLARAAEGLGRPYCLSGRVIGGDRRGRLLGYPTLNLDPPPPNKLLPPDGVYAVRVQTPQGEFQGMLNLGARPTFGDPARRIETHVFDASHDWYGASVRIDLIRRLRDTRSFADAAALQDQLRHDETAAREVLMPSIRD
ncbi:MAG: bifunctional riboflavin kinase/FAD synthetase [Gemmatimonadaceae bacterium]|nr:bifunctional riboflavin kinase/FAD synthetase [Gemmatimonadaceae bacterium]